MASFCAVFFWDLIESVSEGFSSYSFRDDGRFVGWLFWV